MAESNSNEQKNSDNSGIDLLEVFALLIKSWKIISLLVITFAFLSYIFFKVTTVAIFEAELIVGLPETRKFVNLENNGIIELTRPALFSKFILDLSSAENFKRFIDEKKFLSLYFIDSTREKDEMLSDIYDNLEVTVVKPKEEDVKVDYRSRQQVKDESPKEVKLTLKGKDQALLVEILNLYVEQVSIELSLKVEQEYKLLKENKLKLIDREIAVLRQNAEEEKALRIERLEVELKDKISLLQLEKRAVLIEAEANKRTKILQLKEALTLAEILNVKLPTTIESFSNDDEVNTKINVLQSSSLPIYLMGTEFIKKQIKLLENRESEESYIMELNKLEKKILMVKENPMITSLKNRKSNDPFIAELSPKKSIRNMLLSMPNELGSFSSHRLIKKAVVDGQRLGSNKILYWVALNILFTFLTCIVILTIPFLSSKLKEVSV